MGRKSWGKVGGQGGAEVGDGERVSKGSYRLTRATSHAGLLHQAALLGNGLVLSRLFGEPRVAPAGAYNYGSIERLRNIKTL